MNNTQWHYDLHPNVGNGDKLVRFITATVFIGVVLATAPANVGWAVLLPLFAIPIAITAIIGWDPVYALFQKTPIGQLAASKSKRLAKRAAGHE